MFRSSTKTYTGVWLGALATAFLLFCGGRAGAG